MYISSTWPLSVPVHFHCPTNCFWDRLAIAIVTPKESGTVSSAITASRGEIQNIIASTPTTVSTDVMSCVITCCSVVAMLSMSLVTRLSMSPRGRWSKVFSGSRPSLRSTSSRSRNTVRCVTPAMR